MHGKEADLRLHAACYWYAVSTFSCLYISWLLTADCSPFSQRVWIALEAKGQPYQYIETDPPKGPASTPLLEANPRGRVPAIHQGDWACSESAVILEYV
jgi:glutathione S-transferase